MKVFSQKCLWNYRCALEIFSHLCEDLLFPLKFSIFYVIVWVFFEMLFGFWNSGFFITAIHWWSLATLARVQCNHLKQHWEKWVRPQYSKNRSPITLYMRAFKLSNFWFSGLSKYHLHPASMTSWCVMSKSLWSLPVLWRNSSKIKPQCLSFAELSIFSIYCHSRNSLSLSLTCKHFTSACHQYSRVVQSVLIHSAERESSPNDQCLMRFY